MTARDGGHHPDRKGFNQRWRGVYRRGKLPTYTWSNRIEWDKNRSSPSQYEWPPPHQSPSCFPDRISFVDRSFEVNLQVISSEGEQRLDRVWPSSAYCTRKKKKKLPGNRLVLRQGKKDIKYELFAYRLLLYMYVTRKSFNQTGLAKGICVRNRKQTFNGERK